MRFQCCHYGEIRLKQDCNYERWRYRQQACSIGKRPCGGSICSRDRTAKRCLILTELIPPSCMQPCRGPNGRRLTATQMMPATNLMSSRSAPMRHRTVRSLCPAPVPAERLPAHEEPGVVLDMFRLLGKTCRSRLFCNLADKPQKTELHGLAIRKPMSLPLAFSASSNSDPALSRAQIAEIKPKSTLGKPHNGSFLSVSGQLQLLRFF